MSQFRANSRQFRNSGQKVLLPSLVASATVRSQDEAEIVLPPTGRYPHPLSMLVRPIEADKQGDHDGTIFTFVTGHRYPLAHPAFLARS
jgi:hypothetical protein